MHNQYSEESLAIFCFYFVFYWGFVSIYSLSEFNENSRGALQSGLNGCERVTSISNEINCQSITKKVVVISHFTLCCGEFPTEKANINSEKINVIPNKPNRKSEKTHDSRVYMLSMSTKKW